MTYGFWLEPRVDYLKERHAEGMYAADIAADMQVRFEIPVTRNAVIGKLHRLGLHGAHGGPRPNSGRKPTKDHPVASKSTAVTLASEPVDEPTVVYGPFRPCSIADLGNIHCRWIVTDEGEPVSYCGAPYADVDKGMPYCQQHARIAYRRPGVAEPSSEA